MFILSSIIHLLGISILSYILSHRLGNGSLKSLSWPRICVLIVFVESYLFVFSAGVLALGVGMTYSKLACSWGIYLCIIFYLSSKVFVYLFLVERVRLVWQPVSGAKRSQSKVYIISLIMGMVIYSALLVLSLGDGQVSSFDGGVCKIGLKTVATITVLSFELFINLFLTGLFVWPLLHVSSQDVWLRRLAMRTLWATSVAITSSCVNVLILTIMRGREIGWVCLGSCSADVIVNAFVLFLVTDSASGDGPSSNPDTAPRFAPFRLPKNGTELTSTSAPSAPTIGSKMDDDPEGR